MEYLNCVLLLIIAILDSEERIDFTKMLFFMSENIFLDTKNNGPITTHTHRVYFS